MGKTVSRVGRRTKFTPETREKIIELVRCGNFLKVAALAAGVSQSQLHAWLKRGNDAVASLEADQDYDDLPESEREFAEFSEQVYIAEAEAETFHTNNIQMHAQTDWRASQFWLSVRRHRLWADAVDQTKIEQISNENEQEAPKIALSLNVLESSDTEESVIGNRIKSTPEAE